MTGIELLAMAAALLAAVSVLPGTLGISLWTHKINASVPGARFFFGQAIWVLAFAAVLMATALYQAISSQTYTLLLAGAALVFAGVLIFGFFMHIKLMFRPVRKPVFIPPDQAIKAYGPDAEVIGVIDGAGKPWAFITRLARRPHIVYQPGGENPFVMTHCILAHSSMTYAMEGRFQNPDIDVTSVIANNMVFYEKSNNCSVVQLHNQSRDGSLPLATLPTVSCSLKTWNELYPDSQVWIRPITWRDRFYLKVLSRADVIDPASPVMVYPLVHGLDGRLGMKSQVIGVQVGAQSKSYPIALFENRDATVIQDDVGGQSLVLVAAGSGNLVQVYDREVDGKMLDFKPGRTKNHFIDTDGGEWNVQGECVKGKRKGKRLNAVPHYNKIFWYVWADFNPGTAIYAPAGAKTRKKAAA